MSDGMKVSPALVGITGVHHVVSELSRRNMIALPTIRNVAAYDVLVATPDGSKHANIQVKTSLRRVTFFPMPESHRIKAGRHDWYVLLRWLPSCASFEGFMLSGREARLEVALQERLQGKRIRAGTRKGVFPCIHVANPEVAGRAKRWRRRCLQWRL